MTYCFKCKDCGARLTGTDRELNKGAIHCVTPIVRDYRAEAVGVGPGVRVSRDPYGGDVQARARDFLPTADDFAGPGDPDGMKGLRQWRDEHVPTKGDPIGNQLDKKNF